MERAHVQEGCRAVGFTTDSPAVSDVGVVDGILVDGGRGGCRGLGLGQAFVGATDDVTVGRGRLLDRLAVGRLGVTHRKHSSRGFGSAPAG